jgi:DNA-binding GntR family transcriptional regulator
MTSSIALARRSLRNVLCDELSHRIISGRFAPGARLNETEIAAELGVSQTPIREALLSLESQVGIVAHPRRGFRVLELTSQEATELYTLVGHLERFALETQGAPTDETINELTKLNTRLARRAVSVDEALAIDSEWHQRLLADVGSVHLTESIARLKRLLRRYETAYMRSRGHPRLAAVQHRAILTALRAKKIRRAAVLLERNWLAGIGPMRQWLSAEHSS